MGKLTKYIIVMSGLVLLFYFTGILENTGSSTLLTMLLSPEDLPDSSFNAQLLLVLGGIGLGTIIVGIVTRNIELALMAPLAIWLMSLMWDFLYVYVKISQINVVLATLFFAPILFLYGITIVEWWRGMTT